MLDRMPDGMPEDLPDNMPEDMPDRMPDGMPEDMPEHMPEDMPEDMPEHLPEDMPEHLPEDMPGRMPEDMPDRMPDRMPENMSDRMPEDLPVTKCINVMVGITRSKVILLVCTSRFAAMVMLKLMFLSGVVNTIGSHASGNVPFFQGFASHQSKGSLLLSNVFFGGVVPLNKPG